MLHRCWLTVSGTNLRPGSDRGVGVTAFTDQDALNILKETFPTDKYSYTVERIEFDIDLGTLDRNHIIPNMHPSVWRGIWYPMGHARPR
jgi:hypothetical protein